MKRFVFTFSGTHSHQPVNKYKNSEIIKSLTTSLMSMLIGNFFSLSALKLISIIYAKQHAVFFFEFLKWHLCIPHLNNLFAHICCFMLFFFSQCLFETLARVRSLHSMSSAAEYHRN